MYTWILDFFTVFLKNRNINSKVKRSKVTDYAALSVHSSFFSRLDRCRYWQFSEVIQEEDKEE